jgi:hypothetical protein
MEKDLLNEVLDQLFADKVSSPSCRGHYWLLPLATELGSCLRASDWNACLEQAQHLVQNLAACCTGDEEESSALKTTTDGTGTSIEYEPTMTATTATAASSF